MSKEQVKKKSGQQIAAENEAKFAQWLVERAEAVDWEKYTSKTGDKLNRSEIATELNFSRSVMGQNPVIKESLLEMENQLRERGLLRAVGKLDPKAIRAESDRRQQSLGRTQSRVKALEQQVAALTAERDDLKRRVDRLEFLDHHMSTKGRVPH